MQRQKLVWLAVVGAGLCVVPAWAQEQNPAAATAPSGPAAVVNGQEVPESAVQRGLRRIPLPKRDEARPEIVNYLVENVLIDQYLAGLKVEVVSAEVEAKVKQIRDEIQKEGGNFDRVMRDLALTEPDLRNQIAGQLRWEKFAAGQANDKVLQELFVANKEMFDGTMVRARHILLGVDGTNAKAGEDAKAHLAEIKKQVEDAGAQAAAKLPATADNLEKEKARTKAVEEGFSAVATKESACPSKAQGGDLGWFPRAGNMVEPFAQAAFALKPYQMSDPVATPFGQHLILVTDRRPGKEVKYEEVKEEVKEVYGDRLRQAVCKELRARSKVTVNAPPAKVTEQPKTEGR